MAMIYHKDAEKFPFKKSLLDISPKTKKSDAILTFDIEATTFFKHHTTGICYNFWDAVKLKPASSKLSDADYINTYFEKGAYSYIWQFSINEVVYYGRYLEEFPEFLYKFLDQYGCKVKIFVQNLSYEFQFIKNYFVWNNRTFDIETEKEGIVARKMHKVQSVFTEDGKVQFIDTLVLAGVALDKIPSKFGLKIKKLTGFLDYDKIRHSETVLTEEELAYCEYDCLVLYHYILHEKSIVKRLSRLPSTQTGKTRRIVKKAYDTTVPRGHKFRREETARAAPSLKQLLKLYKAFMGGYTHANMLWADKVLEGIRSLDLKSWYPACMVLFKFPTGRWQDMKVDAGTLDYIRDYFDEYAFCITIKFKELKSLGVNTYLSYSRCETNGKTHLDNGRVIYADELTTTITEQDFLIIDENYTYSEIELIDCMYCGKEYIDLEILETIIFLFKEKERIGRLHKDHPERVDYMVQYKGVKERINALYGMSVTNYISDLIKLDDANQWHKEVLDINMISEQHEKLTSDAVLTTPYSWGVWITAYARRGIWEMIHIINVDNVYDDTDSIKLRNYKKWAWAFEWFNDRQHERLKQVEKDRGIDMSALYGIGCFELDSDYRDMEGNIITEEYDEFITLGAKKYCYRHPDGLHITVSGVAKSGAVCLNDDISNFKNGFIFDYRANGKQVVYFDSHQKVTLTDEHGVSSSVEVESGICIYPATKQMNVGRDYRALLRMIDTGEYTDDVLEYVSEQGSLLLKSM